MRRLSRITLFVSVATFVGIFLTVSTFSTHTTSAFESTASCSSHCSAQAQPALPKSQLQQEENDKEPTPILPYWLREPVKLSLLYIAPIVFVVSQLKRNILLQTAQLRL